MEIALISNNSLILGPMGFNVRMINSELEDLELEDRISPQSYAQLPIHFSDGVTHLVPIEKEIPEHDSRYYNIGNFTWEIIEENQIPTKVKLTYPIINKTLEEVKFIRKSEVSPLRRQKENSIISLTVNNTLVEVSASREERTIMSSKLASSTGTYNYKFKNTWLEITSQELQYVISQVDQFIQDAFDWEYNKLQEIDACETIDDVYNVVLQEPINN